MQNSYSQILKKLQKIKHPKKKGHTMKRISAASHHLFTAILMLTISPLSHASESIPQFATVETGVVKTQQGFAYIPVTLNVRSMASILETSGAQIQFPSPDGEDPLTGRITDIDTFTSLDGAVIYSGEIFDSVSREWAGHFTFANVKGSYPYLYVSTRDISYEIIENAETPQNDYLLKWQTLAIAPGKTDPEPTEFRKIASSMGYNTQAMEVQASAPDLLTDDGVTSLSSCNVAVGVGYTSNALSHNGSIVSSINTWMSGLNTMIDDIGVSCNFQLVGTKQFAYQEATHLFDDIYAIEAHSQMVNWKNNTVNADIFVLITSNAEPHTDPYHGVALQNQQSGCSTSYAPTAKCAQFAVVRDDYAYSIRVFAHEVLHMAGAMHTYAYGQPSVTTYGGNGFAAQNNSSERTVTGHGVRSTTVMSNPEAGTMCSSSGTALNLPCGQRLPFIASQTKQRSVHMANANWFPMVTAYFPDFYPAHRNAYGQSSPSMKTVIQNGMNILQNNQ